MAVRVRYTPVERIIRAKIDARLSPQERSKAVARFARVKLDEAQEVNRRVLGRVPEHEQIVNGRRGASLESAHPDRGTIIFRFDLVSDVIAWIMQALVDRSPVGPAGGAGTYREAHRLFADGREVDLGGEVPPAEEYSFTNYLSYSRRLEIGKTKAGRDFLVSVPNRIYERTAKDARARFGNLAKVGFTYRGVVGGGYVGGRAGNKSKMRFPTITVQPI